MQQSPVSTSTDKIIVDKSRGHRNRAVNRAVKATRERLQHGEVGGSAFDRELMVMHLTTALQSASITPYLIIAITFVGTYINNDLRLGAWALVTLVLHAINTLLSRTALRQQITPENAERWKNFLLAGQFALGLGWAYFSMQSCGNCTENSYALFKGAVLLILLSFTALSTFMLRRSVAVTFAPVVILLSIKSVLSRNPYDLGLLGMLCTALLFFIIVTDRMYLSNIKLLSFQSEKDDLIAELETAKSMSDEARRRAEEANLAKSRFLASMSHELRTPLNAIIGFSEMMNAELLGPLGNKRYVDYAGSINESGRYLLDLINDILDMSKIEAGKYELVHEPVNVVKALRLACHMVENTVNEKGINLVFQNQNESAVIEADRRAFMQIMLNLLSNAAKFTESGGSITITISEHTENRISIAVSDTGIGIPADKLHRIGQPFEQISSAMTRGHNGTGLGLAITKKLIEMHDGELKIASTYGKGTTVTVLMPAISNQKQYDLFNAGAKRSMNDFDSEL